MLYKSIVITSLSTATSIPPWPAVGNIYISVLHVGAPHTIDVGTASTLHSRSPGLQMQIGKLRSRFCPNPRVIDFRLYTLLVVGPRQPTHPQYLPLCVCFLSVQQGLPSIDEIGSAQSKSPDLQAVAGAVVKACDIHQHSAERDSPNTTNSTAKSSRRDSLSEKIPTAQQQPIPTGLPHHSQPPHSSSVPPSSAISTPGSTAGGPHSANSPVPLLPAGVPQQPPPNVAGVIYDQPKPT